MQSPKVFITIVVALLALVFSSIAHAMTARRAIKHVFGDSAKARCIARHESSNRPTATHVNANGTVDRGLYQINSIWIGKVVSYYGPGRDVWVRVRFGRIFNPLWNAMYAYAISNGGRDWSPWTTSGYC